MGNYLGYALRETVQNLWRNRLMTMAAVLTVTVSLGLVGSALYLRQGAAQASASWERSEQVIVWLKPGTPMPEHHAIWSQLTSSGLVSNCTFRSQKYDYLEATHIEPESIWGVMKPQTTPSSIRCTPAQPPDASLVLKEYIGQPWIDTATAPLTAIHTVQTTVNWLQVIFLIVALVLLCSAAVLILNTIRMAIFARRREVSVMKLVGATNWFIRVPFIAEGMIQGLLGALLASLVVYGIHVTWDNLSSESTPQQIGYLMRLTGWHVFVTDIVIVVIGGLIGALGSAFAVRRFLDV